MGAAVERGTRASSCVTLYLEGQLSSPEVTELSLLTGIEDVSQVKLSFLETAAKGLNASHTHTHTE